MLATSARMIEWLGFLSYQWANNLLFTLTGNEAPPPAERQALPARSG